MQDAAESDGGIGIDEKPEYNRSMAVCPTVLDHGLALSDRFMLDNRGSKPDVSQGTFRI